MKRIAFITTEFLSEDNTQGGIGNYIFKISSALKKQGHTPEVFVTSFLNGDTVYYNDIKVYRVFVNYFILRAIRKIMKLINIYNYYKIIEDFINSLLVLRKFKSVSSNFTYDIVQTPNYRYPGLFISNNKNYCLYHRISSNRILFDQAEKKKIKVSQKIINQIEIYCARKADIVYAPSGYLANYLSEKYNLKVQVVRPPAYIDNRGKDNIAFDGLLPSKYLLHYGSLGRRKGTDLVAKALKIAWKFEPNLHMVFAGDLNNKLSYILNENYWQNYKQNVVFLGQVEKKFIYGIVEKAMATVLPSRSDNLPNTVIESLSLGTPVIGTYDSSIEEIVEHRKTGILVPNGNTEELANAMIQVWNGKNIFGKDDFSENSLLSSLKINTAVENFINLHKQVD